MDRKLSLQRVLALQAGPLARYLSPLLSQDATVLTHDAYLKTILSSLVDDRTRSTAERLSAADLRGALTLAAAEPGHQDLDAVTVRRAAVLREALNRSGGIYEQEVWEPHRGAAAEQVACTSSSVQAQSDLPVVIWVPHVRSPFNVGNILRSAAGFGVTGVVLGEAVPELSHPRLRRAAMGATEMIPIVRGGYREAGQLLGNTRPIVVALETGGTQISRFAFPLSGIMVVGHEELGTPEEILGECHREGNVVTIPHDGPKFSLNVGVAAGICLSWWQARSATD